MPDFDEVAVQLNYKEPLSFTYTDSETNTVYQNVVVTVSATLVQAIGKTFTFTTVRTPTVADYFVVIPGDCADFQMAYFENIKVK